MEVKKCRHFPLVNVPHPSHCSSAPGGLCLHLTLRCSNARDNVETSCVEGAETKCEVTDVTSSENHTEEIRSGKR